MLKQGYYLAAYAASWVVFGLGAILLTLSCAPFYFLTGPARAQPVVRRVIRRFFCAWTAWLRVAGLVKVNWQGFGDDDAAAAGPAVCVANHPGLLDAVFLLSRLPDAVCVFKPSMAKNPLLAPAAWMGGHTRCGTGPDFVRAAVRRIAEGSTLLIFPEGTRTSAGVALNPLLPGFALIAARAGVPVRVIAIRSSRDLLPRGRPWWQAPQFPTVVNICSEGSIRAPAGSARQTTLCVETRLLTCLA